MPFRMSSPPVRPGLACPVCHARFRGSATCSRCGADLSPLMRLTVAARQRGANALRAAAEGRFDQAASMAATARHLHDTPLTRRLTTILGLLSTSRRRGANEG